MCGQNAVVTEVCVSENSALQPKSPQIIPDPCSFCGWMDGLINIIFILLATDELNRISTSGVGYSPQPSGPLLSKEIHLSAVRLSR